MDARRLIVSAIVFSALSGCKYERHVHAGQIPQIQLENICNVLTAFPELPEEGELCLNVPVKNQSNKSDLEFSKASYRLNGCFTVKAYKNACKIIADAQAANQSYPTDALRDVTARSSKVEGNLVSSTNTVIGRQSCHIFDYGNPNPELDGDHYSEVPGPNNSNLTDRTTISISGTDPCLSPTYTEQEKAICEIGKGLTCRVFRQDLLEIN